MNKYISLRFLLFIALILPIPLHGESRGALSSSTLSNYQEKGSVVIQANITYQIKSVSGFSNPIEIWFQKLENHTSTAQTCEIIHSDYNMVTAAHQIDQDIENNTIEYFGLNLRDNIVFNYTVTYRLHLAHLEWDVDEDISENSEGHFREAYEQCGINTSGTWYQHLTQSENNLEVDNPELISLTHDICEGKPTLQEKIRAILSWLKANIRGEQTKESQGAYLTYIRKVGDCSDYSTMIVTMLRILGVPARKITGVQLIHPPSSSFYPFYVGEAFSYYATKSGDYQYDTNMPGHAWVEYYHPNYGFISLDPTFARNNAKYINYIGYHYLTSNIGENYYDGIDPPFPRPMAGLGTLPYLNSLYPPGLRWNYTLEVKVEETKGYTYIPKLVHDLFPVIISLPFSFSVFIIIRYRNKKKKKNDII